MSAAPTFSVVTPVHDPPLEVWAACVRSVREQRDDGWEWVVVDDGSKDPAIVAALRELDAAEPRVRLITRPRSGGIVEATNDGIMAARGEFLAFLDHDDALELEALSAVRALLDDSEAGLDLVYTDETVVDMADVEIYPMDKPAWSPERLRCQNYVNHLTVLRRELAVEHGGLRSGFDGSQDHDLLLRVTEKDARVAHLARRLYRWRMAPTSILAQGLEGKPTAWENGRRAVQEHCDRTGVAAEVGELKVADLARWYRVHRRPDPRPSVDLIVTLRAKAVPTETPGWSPAAAIRSAVVRGGYPELRVVLVAESGVPEDQVNAVVAEAGVPVSVLRVPADVATPAGMVNAAVIRSRASYLALLDPAAEVRTDGWVEELVSLAADAGVGAVGARLTRPGDVYEQAGFALVGGLPEHLLRGHPLLATEYAGVALVPGERSAVSAALMVTARSAFDDAGGFSTGYGDNYHDVDYCLKLRALGYRVLYLPFVEALCRGRTVRHAEHPDDLAALQRRWQLQLTEDPYINPRVRGANWLTWRA